MAASADSKAAPAPKRVRFSDDPPTAFIYDAGTPEPASSFEEDADAEEEMDILFGLLANPSGARTHHRRSVAAALTAFGGPSIPAAASCQDGRLDRFENIRYDGWEDDQDSDEGAEEEEKESSLGASARPTRASSTHLYLDEQGALQQEYSDSDDDVARVGGELKGKAASARRPGASEKDRDEEEESPDDDDNDDDAEDAARSDGAGGQGSRWGKRRYRHSRGDPLPPRTQRRTLLDDMMNAQTAMLDADGHGDDSTLALMDEAGSDEDTLDPIDWTATTPESLISRDEMKRKRGDTTLPTLPHAAVMHNAANVDGARSSHEMPALTHEAVWFERSLGREALSLATRGQDGGAGRAAEMAAETHVPEPEEAGQFHLANSSARFAARANSIFGQLAPPGSDAPAVGSEHPAMMSDLQDDDARAAPPRHSWTRDPTKWQHYSLADVDESSAATQQAAALDFLNELRQRREREADLTGSRDASSLADDLKAPLLSGKEAMLYHVPAKATSASPIASAMQTPGQLRTLPAVEVGGHGRSRAAPGLGSAGGRTDLHAVGTTAPLGTTEAALANVRLGHLVSHEPVGSELDMATSAADNQVDGGGESFEPANTAQNDDAGFRRVRHRPGRLRGPSGRTFGATNAGDGDDIMDKS